MPKKEKTFGIDLLRNLVGVLNANNETMNQQFTAPQLIRLFEAHLRSKWDLMPDEWSPRQRHEAAHFGITPKWRYDKNNNIVPVYKHPGNKKFHVTCTYTVKADVEVYAKNEKAAKQWADSDMPTPTEAKYVDETFEVVG